MHTPWEHQEECIESVFGYFARGGGNPLVVAPTGSGKSLILAEFIKRALTRFPTTQGQPTRVVVLTHVKELIAQDFNAIRRQWPDAPIGIHSAGLKRRDVRSQVIVAGIQSCHKRAAELYADLVIVDEAHLIPRKSETMYGRFLRELRNINPKVKVIGLTATPYRLDSGMLTEGKGALFDEICHDIPIRFLVDNGYLAPLTSKATDTTLETKGVGRRGGEFIASQLQDAVDKEELNRPIVEEIVRKGEGRKAWMVFCAGVEHGSHVAELLREKGIDAVEVYGDTPDHERDARIAAFKKGQVRALVNVGVLTTGFDAPHVDLLAMMRPTESTGLYVQICGRGMRVAEGKENCLVLDFAGNVRRHGPVDAVSVQRNPGGDSDGLPPARVCPDENCREINSIRAKVCVACGLEFPPPETPEPKLTRTASTAPIMSFEEPEWFEVERTEYATHEKKDKPKSLRVDHYLPGDMKWPVSEWLCFEHGGFAQQKAGTRWVQAGGELPIPATVSEALERLSELARVLRVCTRVEGKFTRVVRIEYGEKLLPWEVEDAAPERSKQETPDDEIPF